MTISWNDYNASGFYDELLTDSGNPRKPARKLLNYLKTLNDGDVASRKHAAELTIKEMGVTFTVYTEEGNIDRAWPFDIIPRIIDKKQWDKTAEGLKQRLQALNMFIDDLYHDQKIIKDGIIPELRLAISAG